MDLVIFDIKEHKAAAGDIALDYYIIPIPYEADMPELQPDLSGPEEGNASERLLFIEHIVGGITSLLFGGTPVLDPDCVACIPVGESGYITGSENILGYIEMLVDFDTAVRSSGLLPALSTKAILWNNVRSLLLAGFLALFSLGTIAEMLLMAPIAIIAYALFEIPKLGLDPWRFLLTSIVPHGVLEIPAAIIATAQAMRMGIAILRDPADGGGVMGILREFGHFVQLFLILILPLLAVAAWIEAQLTPQLVISLLNSLN